MTMREFDAYIGRLHRQIKAKVITIENEKTRVAAYRHSIMTQLDQERSLFTGPQVARLILRAVWPRLEDGTEEESDWETLGRIMKEAKES